MGKYQLLPPLTTAEYEALREDIAVAGVLVPIDVDEHGDILDGHHRKQACDELGIECPTRLVQIPDFAKADYALTVNLARRHLDQKQRRQLVWNSVKDAPNLSDRLHARRCGVSPSTVAAVRSDLVAAELVSNPDTRQDRRGRQQPATKKPAAEEPTATKTDEPPADRNAASSPEVPAVATAGLPETSHPDAPGDEDGVAAPSDAQPPAGDVSNAAGSDETAVQDEAPRQSSGPVELPQEQETTGVSVPAPAGDLQAFTGLAEALCEYLYPHEPHNHRIEDERGIAYAFACPGVPVPSPVGLLEAFADQYERLDVDAHGPLMTTAELEALGNALIRVTNVVELLTQWHERTQA